LTARDGCGEFVVRCDAGRPSHPAFSPDGDALAFELRPTADDHAGVYVQHLDADSAARLGAAGTREGRPVWSPDGGRIALAREVAPGRFEIHTVPALGFGDRSIAVIENAPGAPPRLDWSPDGRFLLTAERSSPEAASYLTFVSLDLGELWRFATPPPGAAACDEAAFSLDGDLVAFRCRFAAGVEDVYVLPLAGRREARRLTFDECPVSGLAWSADGESLIVSSTRQGNLAGLWKVPLSGGEPLRLTAPHETALWPSVCRHRQRIAYVRKTVQSGQPHTEIVLKNPRIDGTFPTFPVSGL
jgi:Tol biopolymer transport system component